MARTCSVLGRSHDERGLHIQFAGLLLGVIVAVGVLMPVIGDMVEVGPEEFRPLRRELREHHPDECHGMCKSPAYKESYRKIVAAMRAYAATHSDYDALDIRRAGYEAMRRHAVPFLFANSPFAFELGVNGGWVVANAPANHINQLCERFYGEKGLVPKAAHERRNLRVHNGYGIVCGAFVDTGHHEIPYRRILRVGFRGIREEVAAELSKCPVDDSRGRKTLETALYGLDTIHEIQSKFEAAARKKLNAPWEPPQTFFEGLNALWFIREVMGYLESTCCNTLGHPDAWLIGLYRADLAAGRITEAEARRLVAQFMIHADCHHDGFSKVKSYADHEMEIPITLGGCDSEGNVVFNELTRMFLEEHYRCRLVFPKLHMRYSRNSPEEYLKIIAELLMKDHAVFAMFNDDIHIPQFVAMGIPITEARQYTLSGCWDGSVDGWTDADTANYLSTAKILENTIYRTDEMKAEEKILGLQIDPIDEAKNFEEVRDIVYRNFIRFVRGEISDVTRYGRATAMVTPYPVYSMCFEGAPSKRCDVNEGAPFVSPRLMTLAFLANTVDSLNAIRKLCFEDKVVTLSEFLDVVRSNWAGEKGERLRHLAMAAPSWGDNTHESNELEKWWIDRFHDDLDGLTSGAEAPFCVCCWVYREFMFWGERMRATPDGRHDGDYLAQGFSPSEFRCRSAATTVLNAIGSLDHSKLYASNANLTFDKTQINREALVAIFRVCARNGMHLLQPNCNSLEELLDAKLHPERHQDLIVKVCGYAARFITLSPKFQDEVIARHRLK